MSSNNTQRFSNRVDDYIKYRPHYPAAIVGYLQQQYCLSGSEWIADIGAGTGISSLLFLDAGYKVVAVEPNEAMRLKSIELLGDHPLFEAVNGTAEDTGLKAHSVPVVVAGQAYHWFNIYPKLKPSFFGYYSPAGL